MVRRTVKLVCCFATLLGIASLTHAHIPDQVETIHFHSGMPDFGTPPKRGTASWENDDRPIRRDLFVSNDYRNGDDWPSDWNTDSDTLWWLKSYQRRWSHVQRLLAAAQWKPAQQAILQLSSDLGWTHEARDSYELVRSVANEGTRYQKAVNEYFHAMNLGDKARDALLRLSQDKSSGPVRAHALYQAACELILPEEKPKAVDEFKSILQEFPSSAMRERALIMLARCAILPDDAANRRPQAGVDSLVQLHREFPHTRFANARLGLMARVAFLNGQYDSASTTYLNIGDIASTEACLKHLQGKARETCELRLMAAYLKRSLRTRDQGDFERGLRRVSTIRGHMNADQARRLAQWLLHDPELANGYLEYRLYHSDPDRADIKTLARLADRIIAYHPQGRSTKIGAFAPAVLTRLSEAFYQDGRYHRALLWAERSLAAKVTDRGLWMRGVCRSRLGNVKAGIADFRELLRRFPKTIMLRGAREQLAVMLEQAGDLGGALDQFFAIRSHGDVAFYLDARMSIPQVEDYLGSAEGLDRNYLADMDNWYFDRADVKLSMSRRNLIRYTLGIRYLRVNRWDEAIRMLRQVPKSDYTTLAAYRSKWDEKRVPDPIAACKDLKRLHHAIAKAPTRERQASAMYAYASYYYKHGTLLLYNPAVWNGQRMLSFDFWWNGGHADKADRIARRKHLYEHEVYARCMDICLYLAKKYPETSSAPKALYRAATSSYWLSNFNDTWRKEVTASGQRNRAANDKKKLAAKYPRSPLAHSAHKYARTFREDG